MKMSLLIIKIIVSLVLVMLGIMDVRRHYIDVRPLIITGPLLFLANIIILGEEYFTLMRLAMVVVGVISLLISILTKEQIGLGDAYVIIWAGLVLDFECYIKMMLVGTGFTFITACILIIIRKKKEIPFIPMLAAGMVLAFII